MTYTDLTVIAITSHIAGDAGGEICCAQQWTTKALQKMRKYQNIIRRGRLVIGPEIRIQLQTFLSLHEILPQVSNSIH